MACLHLPHREEWGLALYSPETFQPALEWRGYCRAYIHGFGKLLASRSREQNTSRKLWRLSPIA